MIGQLGEIKISAVGLCGNYSLIFSVVIGAVSTVAGILIAQFVGANDNKEAWSSFWVSIIVGIMISAVFMFSSIFFPNQILGFYTKDAEIITAGTVYFKIIAFAYIPMAVSNIFILAGFLFCNKQKEEEPVWSLHFQKITIQDYFKMIIPILVSEFLWSLGQNVESAVYGHLGTINLAAYTLTCPVQGLIVGALSGLSAAAGVMVGKRLGRREYDDA